ncbi:MAG: hypothetical protein AUJ96_09205 [Armatimonadetes bacterium CG2_30_66_41]|nr:MAG: hypothetical protein AUJ96_09205 [Armatimonadetes bacterium CG2_30_66_41]
MASGSGMLRSPKWANCSSAWRQLGLRDLLEDRTAKRVGEATPLQLGPLQLRVRRVVGAEPSVK